MCHHGDGKVGLYIVRQHLRGGECTLLPLLPLHTSEMVVASADVAIGRKMMRKSCGKTHVMFLSTEE